MTWAPVMTTAGPPLSLPWIGLSLAALALSWVLLAGHPRPHVLLDPPIKPHPGLLARLPLLPVAGLGAAGGAGLGWVVMGGSLSAALGAGGGMAAAVWLARRGNKAPGNAEAARQFPLVLNFLASVIEAGSPVRSAAQAVSEVVDDGNARHLRAVLACCDVGFSDAEAWRTLSDDTVWGDMARELARGVDTGAALGDVLRAAATQAAKAEAAAATTKARSVGVASTLPLVCCFLPAFLLVGVAPIIGGLLSGYLANW